MSSIDCLIIGAGPAGLGAAVEAAGAGAGVVVADENSRPGGQLFKQIHKFFGSKDHMAGTRGIAIGEQLLHSAAEAGAKILLETPVWGLFQGGIAGISRNGKTRFIRAKKIILATGATENALPLKNGLKPGVMTAGAAQTMANIHRVLPGEKIIMVGTGNVGLIVAYQLMQGGAHISAMVDIRDKAGGYGVHLNKLRRAGVPFYFKHTVIEALGDVRVDGAVLAPLNGAGQPDNEKAFALDADTICFAAGLSPRIELPLLAGCRTLLLPELGGHVPLHGWRMEAGADTFIAGDAAGVEEASTALEEGRLAGLAAARELGYLEDHEAAERFRCIEERLAALRSGAAGQSIAAAKTKLVEAYERI